MNNTKLRNILKTLVTEATMGGITKFEKGKAATEMVNRAILAIQTLAAKESEGANSNE